MVQALVFILLLGTFHVSEKEVQSSSGDLFEHGTFFKTISFCVYLSHRHLFNL